MQSLILAPMRVALWQAIDNWPGLADPKNPTGRYWTRTFRFEDEMPLTNDFAPALGDLPAIGIFPATLKAVWIANQEQNWTLTYPIKIWTPDWNLTIAEQATEETVRAIFRAADVRTPTVPYVKAATGQVPDLQGATFNPTFVGKDRKTKAIETILAIGLSELDDPFID